jgi:hypothetical protein
VIRIWGQPNRVSATVINSTVINAIGMGLETRKPNWQSTVQTDDSGNFLRLFVE